MSEHPNKNNVSIYQNSNEHGVDLKEVFASFKDHRWTVMAFTLVFTVFAAVLAYYSPDEYSASTTVEVQINTKKTRQVDELSMAYETKDVNVDNEIAIIQSRLIIEKALENLNLGVRYFTSERGKTIELYKGSPFIVKVDFMIPSASNYTFQLIPISKDKFRLLVEPSLVYVLTNKVKSLMTDSKIEPIRYDQIHSFGERISTPWFITTIQKIYNLKNSKYTFTIHENKDMYPFIKESLEVTLASELATLIRLDFTDTVPLRAKEILEGITKAYIQKDIQVKTAGHLKKLAFIDKRLAAIKATLTESSTNLASYKTTNTGADLTQTTATTTTKISQLEAQLYELDMQARVLENVNQYINTHENITGIDVGSTTANQTVNAIIQKIQEANTLRNSLLVDYTELHPDVLKATEELNTLTRTLKDSVQSSIRSLNNRKASLKEIIAENKASLVSVPKKERELADLTRNNQVNEKIYSYLLEKRAEIALAETSTSSKSRIIDEATLPDTSSGPNRISMILFGFIIGLFIGLLSALFRSSLDNTIKNVEDIEKLTTIPLYGAVPFLHSQKNIQPYYEALRVIRTNLEFLQNSNKSKLITVTSSIPSEGKSSTVAELGKIMSKANKKVIVIDMDMRRSTLHDKFSLPNDSGVSTLLTNQNTLEEVIQKTNHDNLDIITSGPIPPNASDLLMSKELEKILMHLLEEYDYVLLDSPPIGIVSDAMIIMRMSDINLIVLKANYSHKDYIKNINRFVNDHQLNAGIILNGIELGSKFGYGYAYGYKHGRANSYYSESKV